MKQITLNVLEDPGHAWVKFPRKRLVTLGIHHSISRCSYQRGLAVYLEEDCDAGKLIAALKGQGYTVKFRTAFTDKHSKVRSYDQYSV